MRLTRSILFAAACIFLLSPDLSASEKWRTAPLNTEFLAHRSGMSFNLHSMGGPGRMNTAHRRMLGEVPSPLDLSHVRAPEYFSGIRGGGMCLPRFFLSLHPSASPLRDG